MHVKREGERKRERGRERGGAKEREKREREREREGERERERKRERKGKEREREKERERGRKRGGEKEGERDIGRETLYDLSVGLYNSSRIITIKFQDFFPIKLINLWARPIKVAYSKSNSPNRNCKKCHFREREREKD